MIRLGGSPGSVIAFHPDRELSFWPTPPQVADDLVDGALVPGWGQGEASVDGDVPQVRVLEPSAGDGHLARVIRGYLPRAHLTVVEPAAARVATLRAQRGLADEVAESTLEDYLAGVAVAALTGTWRGFDLVAMNPPFTLANRPEAWAEHVLAVWEDPHLLLPGGTLAAVLPSVVLTGRSRLVRAVRAILGPDQVRFSDGSIRAVDHGRIDPCDRGAFAPVGAGVSAALMWAYRPI